MTSDGNGHHQLTPTRAPVHAGISGQVGNAIGVLLGVVVIGFLAAAPFTWALMLFLGNLGETRMGFVDCLPGGALVGAVVGAGAGRRGT